MTSQQRITAALNHQETDRVPIDFGGHRSSGISALAYLRLREALGLPPVTVRVYDPIQQLAVIDADVLDALAVDTIELGRAFDGACRWVDWTLPNGTPCVMPSWAAPECDQGGWVLRSATSRVLGRMPQGSDFFDQTYWPFLDHDDLQNLSAAFEECMWSAFPSPPGPLTADLLTLAARARTLRQSTHRAILGLFGGNLLEFGQFLYRMDKFMEMLAGQPARVHAFLDKLMEIHMANLERFLGAAGPYIDIIVFGDDLGGQTGPLISPRMYREYFKPRHKAMWTRAKQIGGVKVMLHCCGAIRPLLPDLIEAGLDAINPVQIAGRGMDAAGLKRDFGKDITFWGGGCDTQRVLAACTPAAVRAHVREQVRSLSPGGGFVFQQVHNIMSNVPAANAVAMFEAARECGVV